jgi:hypothetical protein
MQKQTFKTDNKLGIEKLKAEVQAAAAISQA